jgi:hypothetical protein
MIVLRAPRRWLLAGLVGSTVILGLKLAQVSAMTPPELTTKPAPTRETSASPKVTAVTKPAGRRSDEWQGLLVEPTSFSSCRGAHNCGSALGCHAGWCGACLSADDCESGEACVLDHCLTRASVGCESRQDCREGEFCALTGLTGDVRSNAGLRSYCLATSGGEPDQPTRHASDAPERVTRSDLEDLRESVRSAAATLRLAEETL